MAIAAVVAAAVMLTGCTSSSNSPATDGSASASQLNDQSGNTGNGFEGLGITPPEPRPTFTLTDASGKPFSFGIQTAGHPTLLYFGYTNCPDICPETMADVGLALRALPASVQKVTYVVFVTTDIKRDTGPVMKQWLSNFSNGASATWVGLRGTQAQIDFAQTAAHVTVAEDDGQTHSAVVKMYGADDYARVEYPQSTNEQQLIQHDLPLATKA
jgi:protein SCO1/2